MREEKIDLAELRGACDRQLARVRAEWPDGVPITARSLNRAIALGLDLEWAAKRLLRGAAQAEYERVCGPAQAEYDRVCGLAWAEYERVCGLAWAECDRACGAAQVKRDRACGAARVKRDRACGPALLAALIRQRAAARRAQQEVH